MVVFNRKILLERYLDGECTPAERERAERLLERSPSLRDDLDLLRQVDRIVDGAGCFPVHPSYQAQFDRKLAAVEESAEEPEKSKMRPSERRFPVWLFSLTVPRAAGAIAAVLLVIVGAYLLYLSGGAPTRITAVKGSADLYRSGEARWVRARPGIEIRQGDILSTGGDGTVDLTMEGVYALRVKEETRLAARRISRSRRKNFLAFGLKEGRVFVVTFTGFEGRSLALEGPSSEAIARGTAFLFEAGERGSTRLLVESGEVQLIGRFRPEAGKATIAVPAGKYSTVAEGAFPVAPQKIQPGRLKMMREEIADIGRSVWEVSSGPAGKKFAGALISLIISPTAGRVDELLQPCGIMVSQAAPIEVYNSLLEALQSAKKGDYRASAARIRAILEEYPDPRYNSVLKLLLGAQYFAFLSEPDKALDVFEEVARGGEPEWRSLARTAIARIHQELARRSYQAVLKDYTESVDAERARRELEKSDRPLP